MENGERDAATTNFSQYPHRDRQSNKQTASKTLKSAFHETHQTPFKRKKLSVE